MTEPRSQWFPRIPAPLQRLFDLFPLVTYPANELPSRSPVPSSLPTLYAFISDQDALRGLPSFNPSCLKWQTFLKIAGVQFHVVPSTNHASPTGALPFLLPAVAAPGSAEAPAPVPSQKLHKYATEHGTAKVHEVDSLRLEAYQALLDHRIRNAWLLSLYLSPANTGLLSRLYIAPASASAPVRAALLRQLRRAAEAEIVKSSTKPVVEPDELYAEARDAFAALSTLLGGDEWFFGGPEPSLFDASVFAYTHLVLDPGMGWADGSLAGMVGEHPNLVRHRNRLFERCWGREDGWATLGLEDSAYVQVER